MARIEDIESGKRIGLRAGSKIPLALANAQSTGIPLSGIDCMFIVDTYGFKAYQVIAILEMFRVQYDEKAFVQCLEDRDKEPKPTCCLAG